MKLKKKHIKTPGKNRVWYERIADWVLYENFSNFIIPYPSAKSKGMKRTAIYMRVSTDRQAQEGDSIPAQRSALRKYIDEHDDMIYAGEYLDDGISGTKENRDELQRLLEDVREGKIDLIIVTKMDRLHRSLRNFLNMQDVLERHHCDWIAIWEPMYDSSTPQGKMIVNTMMNLAQFEAEQTGQRIRQVQAYKVSKGEVISGTTPPGLKIVDKHLVPDENAHYVREMFEHYAHCGNMMATMRAFDYTGIFPKTKPAYKNLLRNTKYAGFFRDNPDFCEPIVSRELFDEVQRNLTMNVRNSAKHDYIFTGLIHCAECGRTMVAGMYQKTRGGKKEKTRRYRCQGRYSSGIQRCVNSKHIYEHILERYLVAHIREELENYLIRMEVKQKPVRDERKRQEAVQRKLDRLKGLYINDLISLEEYKHDRETLQNDLRATFEQQPVRNTEPIKNLLKTPFEEVYWQLSDIDKRAFWRTIVRDIRIDNNRNIKVFFFE